jgi:hypothetical protein
MQSGAVAMRLRLDNCSTNFSDNLPGLHMETSDSELEFSFGDSQFVTNAVFPGRYPSP